MSAPGSQPGAARFGAAPPPRLIARLRAEASGPTLLVITGLHGNEPAGGLAARRVLARLDQGPGLVRGEIVVLAGNLAALARGVRFVQRDLNRHWSSERIARLRADAANPAVALGLEDREQLELLAAIEQVLTEARGPVHVVDLHTTSAEGIPFAMIGDRLSHRRFALHFPLPLLLGLLGAIGGTLLQYLGERGCVAIGVEGGQHDSPRSAGHHEAVLWIALRAAGLVPADVPADLAAQRDRLARVGAGLPHAMRVNHRHAISPADRFVMQPGFANLQRVSRGTVLAKDARGDIPARRDAILVMPLYQKMGDDGFFLAREIPDPLFRLGAWWGRFALALLVAGLAQFGAGATRAATATHTAACLAIFRGPAEEQDDLFFGPNVARVVPDEHSRFNSFTAREVIAQQSRRSTTEFLLVSVSASFGTMSLGEHRLDPNGNGFAFAWVSDSSGARVAVCEVRHGRPSGIAGVTRLGKREALLVYLMIGGAPCVGVLRVIPLELRDQSEIAAGARFDPGAPNLAIGEAGAELRRVLTEALGK